MEKYVTIKEIGSGTFGRVCRAVNKQSGEVVAIKALKKKCSSWKECLELKEVKCLRKLNHSNIVKCKELIKKNQILYFVFEHMECNLYELIASREQEVFSEAEVRKWCFQVFLGLHHMHQQGYFHRDLKPENLLVRKDIIKIADFGQARKINSRPPYTVKVSTRWYRAPELLLRSTTYNSKVDMWAMGAIMAELITLRPLFQGTNEADQLNKICSVIGSPTMDSWAEGLHQARALNYQFPQFSEVDLSVLIPSTSENAISLIKSLCSWDPCKRPTTAEALRHPFFQSCFFVPPPLPSMLISNLSSLDLSQGVQEISAKQKCHPTLGKIAKGVSDTSESFSNTTIGSHRQSVAQLELPPRETGVQRNFESKDLFQRPFHHVEPAKLYHRKLVEK